jgi:hypothetical protein
MTDRTWKSIRRSVPATERDEVPDNTVTHGAWKTEDSELWITIYRKYRGDPGSSHYVVFEDDTTTEVTEYGSFVAAEAEVEARKTSPALA